MINFDKSLLNGLDSWRLVSLFTPEKCSHWIFIIMFCDITGVFVFRNQLSFFLSRSRSFVDVVSVFNYISFLSVIISPCLPLCSKGGEYKMVYDHFDVGVIIS